MNKKLAHFHTVELVQEVLSRFERSHHEIGSLNIRALRSLRNLALAEIDKRYSAVPPMKNEGSMKGG